MPTPSRPILATLGAAWLAVAALALPRVAHADPVRTGTVELSRATLFYREAGKGRPAVFVHALLTDSRTWNDQLLGLADRSRMFAPDLSGHGFSSQWYADRISSDAYADELLEFIDALRRFWDELDSKGGKR